MKVLPANGSSSTSITIFTARKPMALAIGGIAASPLVEQEIIPKIFSSQQENAI
jgi:hypothetical protein